RYRVREMLLDSLAKVAVLLGEPNWAPQADWHIAVALWTEGRTVSEVADYLSRPRSEIIKARRRIMATLAKGLATAQPALDEQRLENSMNSRLAQLLNEALASPGNKECLARIRENASAIVELLEAQESDETGVQDVARDVDPQW